MLDELVRVVAITGGTHGNERTGVHLAKHLMRNPSLCRRASFETRVLLANVAAMEKNTRYVDEDLNRCFLRKDLADASRTSVEARRAREISGLLGPKGSAAAADFIIDLHNTTAATGVLLMMAPADDLSHAVAAHLMSVDGGVRVSEWSAGTADYSLLPSVGRHGMTFEVGPVSWGCVDGALYSRTLGLLSRALDYVHAHNEAVRAGSAGRWSTATIPVYRGLGAVDYPRDAGGELAAVIHPRLQGRDFEPLRPGDPIFISLDGHTVETFTPKPETARHDVYYPYFVNEAAYYEKGLAFVYACRTHRDVTLAQVPESTASSL